MAEADGCVCSGVARRAVCGVARIFFRCHLQCCAWCHSQCNVWCSAVAGAQPAIGRCLHATAARTPPLLTLRRPPLAQNHHTGGHGLSSSLVSHPLVAAALAGLKNEGSFYAAVDAVSELIWITVDPSTCNPIPEMQPLVLAIVPQVMALRPRFAVAGRRLQSGAWLWLWDRVEGLRGPRWCWQAGRLDGASAVLTAHCI